MQFRQVICIHLSSLNILLLKYFFFYIFILFGKKKKILELQLRGDNIKLTE